MAGRGYEHYPIPVPMPMPGPPIQRPAQPGPDGWMQMPAIVENMAAQGPPPRRKFHGPPMSAAKAEEMSPGLWAPEVGPDELYPTDPEGIFFRMDNETELLGRPLTKQEYWNIMLGKPSDAPVPWSR